MLTNSSFNLGFTWGLEVPSSMPPNAFLEVADIHKSIQEFHTFSLLKASALKAISCVSCVTWVSLSPQHATCLWHTDPSLFQWQQQVLLACRIHSGSYLTYWMGLILLYGCISKLPTFKSQFCHFLSVWTWARNLTSLSLHFHKIGVTILTSYEYYKDSMTYTISRAKTVFGTW